MSIKITELSSEIMKCLNEYTDEVIDTLEKTKENLADDAVKELRATSPKDEGKYAKGWKKRKVGKKYIVHNSVYQITHLLEKGHAKRNGGRVAAILHIAPVEKKTQSKAAKEFKKVLG